MEHLRLMQGRYVTCRELGKIMAKKGGGKIVNILSQGGSRAVVDQITRAFAIELAPYKVNVNVIAQG